jgi:TDG/mug DNA glycosylase family protein
VVSFGESVSSYTPDILAKQLDVIFCGLNPALSAAASGHNFSHPSNRFWPVLHQAGFTAERIDPQNERQLLSYRCGITAVVPRPTRRAGEVRHSEFKAARRTFEAKIRRYQPRAAAFLGKRAFSAMTGHVVPSWGRQPIEFGGALAWILPNPSGLNRAFTFEDLVTAYAELRQAIRHTSPARIGAASFKASLADFKAHKVGYNRTVRKPSNNRILESNPT